MNNEKQRSPEKTQQPKPLEEQPGRTAQSINPGQGTSAPRPEQKRGEHDREQRRT